MDTSMTGGFARPGRLRAVRGITVSALCSMVLLCSGPEAGPFGLTPAASGVEPPRFDLDLPEDICPASPMQDADWPELPSGYEVYARIPDIWDLRVSPVQLTCNYVPADMDELYPNDSYAEAVLIGQIDATLAHSDEHLERAVIEEIDLEGAEAIDFGATPEADYFAGWSDPVIRWNGCQPMDEEPEQPEIAVHHCTMVFSAHQDNLFIKSTFHLRIVGPEAERKTLGTAIALGAAEALAEALPQNH